ncbi:FAD-binding oxidoreductase [Modestobacter sp. VKM Ac-2985]|uniref:FAD-binding oxidoreductase n=1 Tax=Modestobacter sp. VKM Ac-2985 TaxID=3004139 RepID=UPI0022AB5517|nr:FAD-binding oxidoreductase [Modestobacter sp. VKM Ac-2985]MCZ2839242.1 FAD-binding oxidoreductase [Modestobacter sp. VKM Ac-2985]
MTVSLSPPSAAVLAELEAELVSLLGARAVTSELRARERASVDGARMSPIISELLPLGMADLVATPTTAEDIGTVVAAAVRHGVPITPRGKGTGNYGQAIPLAGGLVLDTSRARAVVEVGEGWVTAEAGTPMVTLERAAAATGQQLWMYPSTAQSSLGGFLAGGSGGTGTIAHGSNDMGFVLALDVVLGTGSAELVHVAGEEAQPFVHNYGTAGVIARATVRLEPLQEWRGVFASFPDFPGALSVLRELGRLDPLPRLVSADTPEITATLPADPAFPEGRASLRVVADERSVEAARALIEGAGGRVEDVREGPQVVLGLSMLSYNHPIEWLQKSAPGVWFHVEVSGDALVERIEEVHAVYEGGQLHIEAGHTVPIGMLAGVYRSPEQVRAGIAALNALGVGVHDPHQWNVDFELQRTVETARRTDPGGLLNPGKLNPDYDGPTKGAIR